MADQIKIETTVEGGKQTEDQLNRIAEAAKRAAQVINSGGQLDVSMIPRGYAESAAFFERLNYEFSPDSMRDASKRRIQDSYVTDFFESRRQSAFAKARQQNAARQIAESKRSDDVISMFAARHEKTFEQLRQQNAARQVAESRKSDSVASFFQSRQQQIYDQMREQNIKRQIQLNQQRAETEKQLARDAVTASTRIGAMSFALQSLTSGLEVTTESTNRMLGTLMGAAMSFQMVGGITGSKSMINAGIAMSLAGALGNVIAYAIEKAYIEPKETDYNERGAESASASAARQADDIEKDMNNWDFGFDWGLNPDARLRAMNAAAALREQARRLKPIEDAEGSYASNMDQSERYIPEYVRLQRMRETGEVVVRNLEQAAEKMRGIGNDAKAKELEQRARDVEVGIREREDAIQGRNYGFEVAAAGATERIIQGLSLSQMQGLKPQNIRIDINADGPISRVIAEQIMPMVWNQMQQAFAR